MSTVLEGAKVMIWPLTVVAPGLVNDIARTRYKGQPSATDLWMFEANKIKQAVRQAGFTEVTTIPWGLLRPIVVQRHGLHLSQEKPQLSPAEEQLLHRAVNRDARLNRILPQRCFGSLCLICRA